MADFDLSLVVHAQDDGAAALGGQLEQQLDKVAGAQERTAAAAGSLAEATARVGGEVRSASDAFKSGAASAGSLDEATRRGTTSSTENARRLRDQADALNRVVRATDPTVSSQKMLQAAVASVAGEFVRGKVSAETYARAQAIAARATFDNANSLRAHGAAAGSSRIAQMELMHVARASADAFAAGAPPLQILSMELGRVTQAASYMGGGGALGGVAKFMSTGWGMAIMIGVAALSPLISSLFRTADAAKTAEVGANALGAAQGVLGGMFDLTSGKIEHQNALLLVNARLTALNLRADALKKRAEANEAFNETGETSLMRQIGAAISPVRGGGGPGERFRQAALPSEHFRPFIDAIRNAPANSPARAAALDRALRESEKFPVPSGVGTQSLRQAIINFATADQNEAVAALIDKSLDSGKLAPGLRRDARAKHPKKGPDAAALANFGEDEADRIRNLAASFTDVAPQVDKVTKANEALDKILRDVERRKPPNYKELIADANRARVIIAEGINKPYNDFILKQNDALAVQKLISQGRMDEADATKIILDLERQQGPLTAAQKDGVLATVQALRAEQREQDILHEKQQKYLTALATTKDAVHAIFVDPLRGIQDLPQKLLGAFTQLRADKLFESMFGDTFRQLQDKITGADVAKDAAARMADAVDHVTAQTDRTTAALDALAASATNAAAGIAGPGASLSAPGSRMSDLAATVGGLQNGGGLPSLFEKWFPEIATVGAVAGVSRRNNAAAGNDEIVVHGQRTTTATFSSWIEKLSKGVGISDAAASKIGSFAGKGLEGAATGAMVNSFLRPLGKALGVKTSQTGAEIGGAIGSFVPIPGGQIIGSIAGSIIGGLFKKTVVKSGGATITSAFDAATMSGNNAEAKKAATGAGSNVQDAIANIAQQLGGTPGAFKISIGAANGKWSVDPLGLGRSAKPGKGGVAFGTDEAAATAFAIQTAISQGAVSGLSKAVAAALQSSPDINKALAEALNVKNLEILIGGLGSELAAQFQNFDVQAAERVRLAKKYGLDILAVEKINGEQRAKLIDDLTKQRIGVLLDFQKELKYGDLFEGDAAARRSALMDEIGKIVPNAEAGKEGAAQQLADLYKQLITTSRDAFGTAGPEYAADRAAAATEIDRVIQMENDRIAAASAQQQAQTDALNTNNNLTGETNDLLAITNAKLDTLIGVNGGSIIGGGKTDAVGTLSDVARFTDLTSRIFA